LPGSLIPAQWGNAVTKEILNTILAAGLIPDEVDNEQLVAAIRLLAAGRLLNIQVFKTAGTFTYVPTPGMKSVVFEVRGGGGGSGGVVETSATLYAVGGGGGGGAKAIGRFLAADIGVSQLITVGQGGAGGNVGANPGGNGGTSSIGALIAAAGGKGANSATVSALPANIASGTVGGQLIVGGNVLAEPGQPGGLGQYMNSSYRGGIGGGPAGGVGGTVGDTVPPSGGSGSGAGGNVAQPSSPARAGGAGGNGYVTAWEYA